MPRLFAFLRAINVGGHTVRMEELRRLFEKLGFEEVETFIASGNVIFTTPVKNARALEQKIEQRLQASLHYEVKTFLRNERELSAIVRYEPFEKSRIESAGAFCVGFLAEPIGAAARKSLEAMKTEIDDFHVHDRELYWLCRKQQHESTFSNVRFERALKIRTTFRNVNTVTRLAAKYSPTP